MAMPSEAEQIVPIPGLLGYWAGSDGSIWKGNMSCLYKLAPRHDDAGYLAVSVDVGGDRTSYRVHKLVALSFHGPPPPGCEVRHLDDHKPNCRADNLCYGTRQQNMEDAARNGKTTRGEKNRHAKLIEPQVREIKWLMSIGWQGVRLAARYNVSQQTICDIRKGRLWSWVKVPPTEPKSLQVSRQELAV